MQRSVARGETIQPMSRFFVACVAPLFRSMMPCMPMHHMLFDFSLACVFNSRPAFGSYMIASDVAKVAIMKINGTTKSSVYGNGISSHQQIWLLEHDCGR